MRVFEKNSRYSKGRVVMVEGLGLRLMKLIFRPGIWLVRLQNQGELCNLYDEEGRKKKEK